jgi:hypothetical protein
MRFPFLSIGQEHMPKSEDHEGGCVDEAFAQRSASDDLSAEAQRAKADKSLRSQ